MVAENMMKTRARDGHKGGRPEAAGDLAAEPRRQTPLEFALSIMCDATKPDALRVAMANAAMPYLHGRWAPMESGREHARLVQRLFAQAGRENAEAGKAAAPLPRDRPDARQSAVVARAVRDAPPGASATLARESAHAAVPPRPAPAPASVPVYRPLPAPMRAVASPPPPTLAPTPDASRDFASTSGKHAPLAPGDVRVRRRVLPDDERDTTRSHLDDLDPHPGYRWIP